MVIIQLYHELLTSLKHYGDFHSLGPPQLGGLGQSDPVAPHVGTPGNMNPMDSVIDSEVYLIHVAAETMMILRRA